MPRVSNVSVQDVSLTSKENNFINMAANHTVSCMVRRDRSSEFQIFFYGMDGSRFFPNVNVKYCGVFRGVMDCSVSKQIVISFG